MIVKSYRIKKTKTGVLVITPEVRNSKGRSSRVHRLRASGRDVAEILAEVQQNVKAASV